MHDSAAAPSGPAGVESLVRSDVEHVIHPLQFPSDHGRPIIFVRGEGVELIDADGKRYIDSLSGLWNVAVGHGRAELAEAAAEQMRTLEYASSYVGYSNVPSIQLAEKLASLNSLGLTSAYFTTGGAESNESAFKIARYFWKLQGKPDKVKFISRRWGYHGVTFATASATGLAAYHQMFAPLVPGFLQTVAPYRFRCELEGGDTPRPCTNPDEHDYAAALEQALIEAGPETVAGIIAEPVLGAGGVIPPPEDYWPNLRAIADRHQVLLIADEIITGFGRTGKWFALEHWGVRPDMLVFAKAVTSGYVPLGGVLLSEGLHQAILEAPPSLKFTHAATYSGHPTCCAVALANLAIFERERLVERAAENGPWFLEQLGELRDLPGVGDVRGLGMMAGVELVDPAQSGAAYYDAAAARAARVSRACHERGMTLRLRGNVIVLAPPLVSDRAVLRRIVDILADALRATP